jgi:hypothetical protein
VLNLVCIALLFQNRVEVLVLALDGVFEFLSCVFLM